MNYSIFWGDEGQDSGYHVNGELVVAPDRSLNPALDQLNRMTAVCGGRPLFVVTPLPRYISISVATITDT